MVDNACVSLAFIAEASVGQPRLLEALTGGSLVGEALQMVRARVRSMKGRGTHVDAAVLIAWLVGKKV